MFLNKDKPSFIFLGEADMSDKTSTGYGRTGTYVALVADKATQDRISQFQTDIGIEDGVSGDKLHTTLIYSRRIHDDMVAQPSEVYTARHKGYALFGQEKKALVMLLDAPEVCARHEQLMKDHDATYDFSEYQPHITLSYDVPEDFDVSKLPTFEGDIVMTGEYKEDLVDD
jgi:2'-5' RNA ligase